MHRANVSDMRQSRPEGGRECDHAACSLSAPSANSNARSAALWGVRVRSLRMQCSRVPDDAKRVSRSLDSEGVRNSLCQVQRGVQSRTPVELVGRRALVRDGELRTHACRCSRRRRWGLRASGSLGCSRGNGAAGRGGLQWGIHSAMTAQDCAHKNAGPLLTCVGSIRVMFPIIAWCNVQMYPIRGRVAPRGGVKVIVPLPVSVPPVLLATHGPLHSGKVAYDACGCLSAVSPMMRNGWAGVWTVKVYVTPLVKINVGFKAVPRLNLYADAAWFETMNWFGLIGVGEKVGVGVDVWLGVWLVEGVCERHKAGSLDISTHNQSQKGRFLTCVGSMSLKLPIIA
jgi:hypothetical protein